MGELRDSSREGLSGTARSYTTLLTNRASQQYLSSLYSGNLGLELGLAEGWFLSLEGRWGIDCVISPGCDVDTLQMYPRSPFQSYRGCSCVPMKGWHRARPPVPAGGPSALSCVRPTSWITGSACKLLSFLPRIKQLPRASCSSGLLRGRGGRESTGIVLERLNASQHSRGRIGSWAFPSRAGSWKKLRKGGFLSLVRVHFLRSA